MAGEYPVGPGAARTGVVAELISAGFTEAREVGRGASGVVYRCHQVSLGRTVAIKVLASDLDPQSRERFLREGYAMGRLSGHPNIVNILQVGVTPSGRPYIVMPYHRGDSLASRLQQFGAMSWPEALRIGVKLCGALETAHKSGTLHRDIKPGNVLLTDYGEPQLSDFGIARITGGYETVTGVFSGTIAFTAAEVLSGEQPSVVADVYSLAATLYTLIAGNAAHDNRSGEQLIAQYMRITTAPIPDLRPRGIPDTVCKVIEQAMSLHPDERPSTAEDFGHLLQAAQRQNGLPTDTMALPTLGDDEDSPTTMTTQKMSKVSGPPQSGPYPPSSHPSGAGAPMSGPPVGTQPSVMPMATGSGHASDDIYAFNSRAGSMSQPPPPPPYQGQQSWNQSIPPQGPPPNSDAAQRRNRLLIIGGAAALALLLVIATITFIAVRSSDDTAGSGGGSTTATALPPTELVQQPWEPITNARVARTAVATTQSDGTIWIVGGINSDGSVSGRQEGYDPAIDNWKGGDDLPTPVQHAMAVTWNGNPVVLGGSETNGDATDRVWRMINSRWVELPQLLQPRSAGAAAVVGDNIIVTGGVGADGELLNTTEIFDGGTWRLAAELPTPRQLLGAASDGDRVYVVGGRGADADLAVVEVYDPATNAWSTLPNLAQPRSDLGVTVADGRLVAVGGLSNDQVLKSVVAFDLSGMTWDELPDMGTARHGMAVASVDAKVYAIGGSSDSGDDNVLSTAESVELLPRKLQPADKWRSLPDGPTARLMMASTVLDGKIWVIGGMIHGRTLQTVETFDPQTGTWTSQPPIPIPIHHATAAVFRGEVVVIGGTSDQLAEASNKVFVFRGGTWTELPSLTHARAAAAATVVGDKIIVVGGQNAKELIPQTEVFDGTSWSDAANMPTPREHLSAVTDGTYVYTLGGRFLSSDKNSGAFERFDPASGEWVTLTDMPTPRGSYGAAFIDGRIVAVGGEEPTRVLDTVEMYDIAEEEWSELTPIPVALHGETVAAVGNTVYVIGGADRPTHEGPVATVSALDFT
ncbi:MAG: Kelch repeat-containing protein [Mycobacterium sp.]